MTTAQHFLNGRPVTIIGRENRHEVWIETAEGTVLRVFKAGLSTTAPTVAANLTFTIDNTRGTDGAR